MDALRTWNMDHLSDLADTAVLLMNELVTNAVMHAQTPIHLVLAAAQGTLEIGVTDLSRRMPRRGHVLPPEYEVTTHGRGMRMIETVADDWGVVPLPEGNEVGFSLQTGRGQLPASAKAKTCHGYV